MRIGHLIRSATLSLAAGALALAPVSAAAEGTGTYYDRSFVLAAHGKCGLFRAPVAGALSAATLQARGAALRGGVAEARLDETAGRARATATRVSCANPELRLVRDRVTHAFEGWQRTPRMDFVSGGATWAADRVRRATPSWRLVQTSVTGASPVSVGVSAAPDGRESLSVVVSFVGRPRPYAARIVMRDPALSARPWLTATGAGVLPPEASRRAAWSAGVAPAAESLLADGRVQGETWAFADVTGEQLARLDPREPFVVEFLFRDGSIASARFETGDFAAARAFVAMGAI